MLRDYPGVTVHACYQCSWESGSGEWSPVQSQPVGLAKVNLECTVRFRPAKVKQQERRRKSKGWQQKTGGGMNRRRTGWLKTVHQMAGGGQGQCSCQVRDSGGNAMNPT